MLIYIVSHGSYNDDGEFDSYGVDAAFYNEKDALAFKAKRESNWGEDYQIDELEVK